ncbi:flagellar basal body rod protein FlgC [Planctomycetota bacterium]
MFSSLDISASGLSSQRLRMTTIANNVANINTTRDEEGRANPYKRRIVLFEEGSAGRDGTMGVHVPEIVLDDKAPHMEYNPSHPDANAEGYVAKPNINMIEEMVDMIAATRAYEANVTVMEATKSMYATALRIIA